MNLHLKIEDIVMDDDISVKNEATNYSIVCEYIKNRKPLLRQVQAFELSEITNDINETCKLSNIIDNRFVSDIWSDILDKI